MTGKPVWSDERIEQELLEVHRNEPLFLNTQQLVDRGKSTLMQQLSRRGRDYWAERIGKPRHAWSPKPAIGVEQALAQAAAAVSRLGGLPGAGRLRAAGYGQLVSHMAREEVTRQEMLRRLGYSEKDIPQLIRQRSTHSPQPWTQERIRQELAAACKGRTTFPTITDLQRLDRADLYSAVVRYGGLNYWSEQMGLPRNQASLRRSARGL